jgi:hypothetical protein
VSPARRWVVAASLAVLAARPAPGRVDDTLEAASRLAALAKTWGLLKYFHPDVARGTVDWDAALLDAIPRVAAAESKKDFNDEVMRLIRAAGPPPRGLAAAPGDRPEGDPAFRWIDDEQLFDRSTVAALKEIRQADVPATNRYVKPAPSGNPDFGGEAAYDAPAYPGREMRLLALFRFWNMVQYFYPNRDLTDRRWPDVLAELIPRFIDASNATEYHLAASELTASINDTHAVTSSAVLSSYWGPNEPPIRTRFIEQQPVVTAVFERLAGGADVRPGDVITHIDGVEAGERRAAARRYVWGSNEGAVERNINSLVLRTSSSTIALGVSRFGVQKTVTMGAVPLTTVSAEETAAAAARPKWKTLPGNVGYVDMGLLEQADVPSMMAELRGTRAIVFDVRNYPRGTMYLIAQQLNPGPREFARLQQPRYDAPGTLLWKPAMTVGPPTPTGTYYAGRVVLLGDERTQSHAEFTMLALRTAPDVIVVGTATAGADGDVSRIALPGGIRTLFSGLSVFYPDGRPTQRVGIVPDVVVAPTIAGVQRGVDEVLERALTLL